MFYKTKMAQQNRIGSHKTTIRTEGGLTQVIYWETAVLSFDAHFIALNNGGYYTATTKTRINQAFNQFGLGYALFQREGLWFIERLDNHEIQEWKGQTLNLPNYKNGYE